MSELGPGYSSPVVRAVLLPDGNTSAKTFRDPTPLGEGSLTGRRAGLVDGALPVSCPWIFVL